MRKPTRVLVVDDSAFVRYTVTRHLSADPDIAVIGSAHDGIEALAKIHELNPDVVTLDVEMPRLDGLGTLKRIMVECPVPVVMLSSLTQRGASTTIKALMRGAVDFVAKPSTSADTRTVMDELIIKVKTAAGTELGAGGQTHRPVEPAVVTAPSTAPVKGGLRPFRKGDPLIVIGTSTGGPRALSQVLSDLPADLPAAVSVVQHMPPGFTRSLAQRLNETCPISVQEAADGDRLAQGLALIAPGDYHLRFEGANKVSLNQEARHNHLRPAVDVTMRSAADLHGSSVIAVILTGMGNDGTQGAEQIKLAGGRVLAQDAATSVVYGMPRSVVEAGLADYQLPLEEVGALLVELVTNGQQRI
jgi:two-component system, chemotaxis family, protein-glutamate methylesterase/glutaminase